MGLVQNDESVVEGSPAHVGQRGDFYDSGFHHFGDGFCLYHVAQCIVQGAQVGVDLLIQCAGEESQLLPRFDRRAGQDDAANFLIIKRLHSLGHRQIGLAGTRGAYAEDDGVLIDGFHVCFLACGFGAHYFAAAGDDVVGDDLTDTVHRPGGVFDGVGAQRVATACHGFEVP